MTSSSFSSFLSPAKLNLFLHITGRNADGYHLLQTIFRFIDLYDTLHIKPTANGVIRRINEVTGVSEAHDLCLRAARLLQTYSGSHMGVDIALEKHIPLGGGLGGGSSNAATTLLALNQLWGLQLGNEELMFLGKQLGADVPVFINGHNAWGEGIGDVLFPLRLPPACYVVITPPIEVSTARVFEDFQLTSQAKPKRMHRLCTDAGQSPSGNYQAYLATLGLHNQLEARVGRLYPQVAEVLTWLRQFGVASMSGSGASLFLETPNLAYADSVCQQRPRNTSGFVVSGIDVHPLYARV